MRAFAEGMVNRWCFHESVARLHAQNSAGAAGAGSVHCPQCTYFRPANPNQRLKNTSSRLIQELYEIL